MLVLIAALLAAQPVPQQTAKSPAKVDDDQRVKCHTEEQIGSLVGHHRVCHTNAEWRAIAEAAERGARDVQERGLIQPTHGG